MPDVAESVEPQVPHIARLDKRDAKWLCALILLTVGLSVLPLLFNHNYYYIDDSAGGSFGQWYELGRQLLSGHWPMLNPAAWMAGNYLVDGQWGLYNPLIWVIAVFSTITPSAAGFTTIVKILFLLITATGVYALVRSYNTRPAYGLLAGLSVAFAGWTFHMDAGTWVTNLEVFSYFPWVFWGLRHWAFSARRAGLTFLAIYLLITTGYVQGAVALIIGFVSILLECIAYRPARRFVIRVLLMGLAAALITITVFLPGLASVGVTTRSGGISNNDFLTANLNGLAVGSVPNARPQVNGYWSGNYVAVPITYMAWFLPALALVQWRRVKNSIPVLRGMAIFGTLMLLLTTSPSSVGPLRYPIRNLPWLTLAVIVMACVTLDHGLDPARINRRQIVLFCCLTMVPFWISYRGTPEHFKGFIVAAGAIISATLLAVMITNRMLRFSHVRSRTLGLFFVIITIAVTTTQTIYLHGTSSPFGWSLESSTKALEKPLPGAHGDVLVIGSILDLKGTTPSPNSAGTGFPPNIPSGYWTESSAANLWYLKSSVNTLNLYTAVGNSSASRDLCMETFYGFTCPDAFTKLFTKDATTGETLADLMSLDSVVVIVPANSDAHQIATTYSTPQGWHIANIGTYTVTWARDQTTPVIGSPTWSSNGLNYEIVSETPTTVKLRINSVPSEGGDIVFSRLAWPGYMARGAEIATPLRGYLLRVHVPASNTGGTITVQFRPPLWNLQVIALALSLLIWLGLTLFSIRSGRRDTRLRGDAELVAH